jgi:hypothetical protein
MGGVADSRRGRRGLVREEEEVCVSHANRAASRALAVSNINLKKEAFRVFFNDTVCSLLLDPSSLHLIFFRLIFTPLYF